jgi:hypothetical protein
MRPSATPSLIIVRRARYALPAWPCPRSAARSAYHCRTRAVVTSPSSRSPSCGSTFPQEPRRQLRRPGRPAGLALPVEPAGCESRQRRLASRRVDPRPSVDLVLLVHQPLPSGGLVRQRLRAVHVLALSEVPRLPAPGAEPAQLAERSLGPGGHVPSLLVEHVYGYTGGLDTQHPKSLLATSTLAAIYPVIQGVFLVGRAGLEPATPRPPVWCATKLRHRPCVVRNTTLPGLRYPTATCGRGVMGASAVTRAEAA